MRPHASTAVLAQDDAMLADFFRPTRFTTTRARRTLASGLTLLLLAAVGCDTNVPPGGSAPVGTGASTAAAAPKKIVIPDGVLETGPSGPANESAAALLGRVAAAYQTANSYSDEGRLVVWSVSGTSSAGDVHAPFSLQFERPNKFRLTCYDADASCDGREMLAKIGEYPDQMLRAEAPAKITPDDILRDRTFDLAVGGRFGIRSPLIGLAFDPEAIKSLVFDTGTPKFDPPGTFENHPCWRVRTPTPAGDLVYWVDQQSAILRRIELPSADIKTQLDPHVRWSAMALTIDFNKAAFNVPISAQRFTLGISQDVALVRRFVDVIPPAPPSPLLGKPVPDLKVKASNGQELSLRAFQGKTLVVEVWGTGDIWSEQSLPLMEKAFTKFRDNGSVQFLALSVDPPAVNDPTIVAALQRMHVTLPWAREQGTAVVKTLADDHGTLTLPALLIVDSSGVVQVHEMGFNDRLRAGLPELVNSIRSGKQVSKQTIDQYAVDKKNYESKLLAGGVEDAPEAAVAAAVKPVPRAEPTTVSIHSLFALPQLHPRGSILPLPAEGNKPERVAVIDDWRKVVEINAEGRTLGEFELGLPLKSVATLLRTAVQADGKRVFAAVGPDQTQAFAFDGDWKPLFAYPNDGTSLRATDVLLTDAEKAGEIELVIGCYGESGVHGVDLTGKRKWVMGRFVDAAHIAAGPRAGAARTILTANKRGTLVAFEPPGEDAREMAAGPTAPRPYGEFLLTLQGADLDGDGASEFAGLAWSSEGEHLLMGLRPDGSAPWRLGGVAGALNTAEPITTGPFPGVSGDVWVVATSNGRILFVSPAGKLLDVFAFGKPLVGVRLTKLGGKPMLFVSSVDAENRPLLEAFELRGK